MKKQIEKIQWTMDQKINKVMELLRKLDKKSTHQVKDDLQKSFSESGIGDKEKIGFSGFRKMLSKLNDDERDIGTQFEKLRLDKDN